MTDQGPAIAATGLRKSFGDHLVLDGVDLEVAEGTTFALLGPNGAGKTTIVQILSTLIRADAGSLRVAGHDVTRDPDAVRAAIGVTGQFSAVDNLLTGEENLILMADLNHLGRAEGRRRAAELLDRFDLADAATRTAATYSGGMRRRLDLAMTLVGDPRVIFLDEPTTGLDPRSRRAMWDSIRDLVTLGVTVLLTTQYVEAASDLPMPLFLLPFLGSGFVPTDSMPTGMRWFAEYQPFTPIMETLRGLLMGTPIGDSGVLAVAWCAGIGLVGYLWAKRLFDRDPMP